jgi:hypothetical protein
MGGGSKCKNQQGKETSRQTQQQSHKVRQHQGRCRSKVAANDQAAQSQHNTQSRKDLYVYAPGNGDAPIAVVSSSKQKQYTQPPCITLTLTQNDRIAGMANAEGHSACICPSTYTPCGGLMPFRPLHWWAMCPLAAEAWRVLASGGLPSASVACLGTAPFLFSPLAVLCRCCRFPFGVCAGGRCGPCFCWLVLCVVVPFLCSGCFVLLCGFCCLHCVLCRPVLRDRLCYLRVPLGFLLPILSLRYSFASLCNTLPPHSGMDCHHATTAGTHACNTVQVCTPPPLLSSQQTLMTERKGMNHRSALLSGTKTCSTTHRRLTALSREQDNAQPIFG